MMSRDLKRGDTASTFANGLRVIGAFDAEDRDMSVPQIARKTGLDRAAARRLVLTLVAEGYAEEREQRYRLTPRVLRLGRAFLDARRVGAVLQPLLAEATRRLGLPVSFAMRDGFEALYLAHAPGEPSLISTGFTTGTALPLLTSGLGRAVCAALTPAELEEVLAGAPLVAHTAATCLDRAEIGARIAAARNRGLAYVAEEFEPGVAALAAPVRGGAGEIAGAVGVAGVIARVPHPDAAPELAAALSEIARALAGRM
ncbi:IclR family transcriptional regulator [Paroceanicella profunda]|nr:IclR family transcriptional regulator C-terminal domain-containing protein [Paroceanicella profunda]